MHYWTKGANYGSAYVYNGNNIAKNKEKLAQDGSLRIKCNIPELGAGIEEQFCI